MRFPPEAQPVDRDEREAWPWRAAPTCPRGAPTGGGLSAAARQVEGEKVGSPHCEPPLLALRGPEAGATPGRCPALGCGLRARRPAPPTWRQVKGSQKAFAERFKREYACTLLEAYLGQLAILPGGGFLPERVINYLLQYLTSAIPKKVTYKALRPHVQQMLLSVVFPALCFNERDSELWEEDPHEYIRKGYDIIEDMYSPRTGAMNFVQELMRCRPVRRPLPPGGSSLPSLTASIYYAGPSAPISVLPGQRLCALCRRHASAWAVRRPAPVRFPALQV